MSEFVGDSASGSGSAEEVFVADKKQFSEEDINAFREVFAAVDTDNSGSVSSSELQNMFAKLGYEVTPELVAQVISQVDGDGSKTLSFDEFVSLLVLIVEASNAQQSGDVQEATNEAGEAEAAIVLSEDATNAARELFDAVDTDKSGSVSNTELGELLRQLGYNASEEQLAQLVAVVDDDSSGNLNFDEFVRLIVLLLQSS